jgi:hypothetical protein
LCIASIKSGFNFLLERRHPFVTVIGVLVRQGFDLFDRFALQSGKRAGFTAGHVVSFWLWG